MEIVVVVKVAVLVDVQPVEYAVVVVVYVLPVVNAVAVPVVVSCVRLTHQDAVLVGVDRIWVGEARAVPVLDLIVGRVHVRILLVGYTIIIQVERDVVGVHRRAPEGVVRQSRSPHVRVQPVPNQIVVLIDRSVPVIVDVPIVVHLAIHPWDLNLGVWHRVVAQPIAVGVNLVAGVRDSVVVIIDVVHVHQAVVVVIGVG